MAVRGNASKLTWEPIPAAPSLKNILRKSVSRRREASASGSGGGGATPVLKLSVMCN